jgi:predicted metal-dependent hydrolase
VSPAYHLSFELDSEVVPLTVRRTRRKTLLLLVHPGGSVECRIPLRCPLRLIQAYVEEKLDWLRTALQEMRSVTMPRTRALVDQGEARLFGEWHPVRVYQGRHQSVVLAEDGFYLTVVDPSDGKKVERLFDRWMRGLAERVFKEQLAALSRQFKSPMPTSITLRKMRGKWGSCSRDGQITLSVGLLEQPRDAIEYVLWHELCHLTHFDHSKAFYALLASQMPDWQARKQRLEI